MKAGKGSLISVCLIVALGGFLLGFDATLIFVLLFIPETKRKTLEELETVLLRH